MDPLSESIYQLATIQFLRTSCELILLFSALNSLNYRAGYHIWRQKATRMSEVQNDRDV